MTEAAEKHGVQLLCGHTASLMAANQAMRRLITSGAIGAVQAINVWSYTDWMFRPRLPQELDIRTGGGIIYRQGPHQVDTVRLLGGGRVRSVRAMTGKWFPGREVEGYYVAFLEFENGVPATIVHNGYGYFSTYELVPWAGSSRYRAASVELRRAIRAGRTNADQEALLKNEVRFGGSREAGTGEPAGLPVTARGFQGDLGLVVVSCARGDVRQSPNGLWVYDDDGQREVPVEGLHDERMAELDEMYQALTTGRPVRHNGRWGTATLEVVLAIMQSAREHREIMLSHQCDAY
jgi:phthalate 4,5-cis-dihydrodiol dehydrogenase